MPEWVNEFQHESITPENKEAFTSAMSKYDSPEAAIVGGFNAQQMTGKPFRMPESLDKLPDDATRDDFRSQANKLLGVQHVKSVDDLKALDLKAGSKNDTPADEALAGLVKEYAVEKGWPVSVVQDIVGFNNGPLAEHMSKMMEAQTAKAEEDSIAQMKAADDELVKMLGSREEVDKQSELFKRGLKNGFDLSADDVDEVVEAMVKGGLTSNAKTAAVLLKAIAPYGAEGGSEQGKGGNPQAKAKTPAELMPKTAAALNWNG
jgi:soluble cytochrome b562